MGNPFPFPIKPDFPSISLVRTGVREGDLNNVWRILQNFLALVEQAPISPQAHQYTLQLRDATFIPFGGPNLWNRRTELILREIEAADAAHTGLTMHENLEVEWAKSGLNREENLYGDVEIVCTRCGR